MQDGFPGEKSDVAIVGAGIAGLTLALTLVDLARAENLPLPRIEIVEAGDRIGGRAQSVLVNGRAVNKGGQWLHDMSGNPFYQWLQQRYPDLTYSEDHVARDVVLTDEGLQPPEFYSEQFKILTDTYLKFKETHPDEDISLADLVPLVPDTKAPMLADYVARNWMAEDDMSLISCDELFAADGYGPGGPQVKEGMSAVTGKMANELKDAGVHINTSMPVQFCEQGLQGVRLTTPDVAFDSNYAAITASVGVMQAGVIKFDPKLDPAVTSYFNSLSMGKMTKILVPLTDEFMDGHGIHDNTFMSIMNGKYQVFCHARSAGAPVVSIFVAGRDAEAFERDPAAAEAFAEKFLDALGNFKGFREAISAPVTVGGFNTDPHILGSYSAVKPGMKRADPMRDGRLYFTGEAFVTRDENGKESGATMSGAFSAARKTAMELFEVLRPLLLARKLTPGQGPSL